MKEIFLKISNYLRKPEMEPYIGLFAALPIIIGVYLAIHVATEYFTSRVIIRLILFIFGFSFLGFIPANFILKFKSLYLGHKISLISLIIGLTLSILAYKI